MRYVFLMLTAAMLFSGCTVKEFGDGVSDGIDDVKRVIRGNNN